MNGVKGMNVSNRFICELDNFLGSITINFIMAFEVELMACNS
jgi:hypothetical protein